MNKISFRLGILCILIMLSAGCGAAREESKSTQSETKTETTEAAVREETAKEELESAVKEEEAANTEVQEETVSSDESPRSKLPEQEESEEENVVESDDTIAWFNAAGAVLTTMNGWDYQIYGGMEKDSSSAEITQMLLEEWWGVTDEASAMETMEWLISEGHNLELLDDLLYFDEEGLKDVAQEDRADFIYENWEVTEEMAKLYAECYGRFEAGELEVISGWDFSRAFNLLSWYYIAGYCSKEEALDLSLMLAEHAQKTFDSWDDFMDSYFLGYEYWAEESSGERQKIYRMLREMEDGPYAVDWNLKLEQSW